MPQPQWDKWYEHLGSKGLAKAFDPLIVTGKISDPRKRHITPPAVTKQDIDSRGIQDWLNRMNTPNRWSRNVWTYSAANPRSSKPRLQTRDAQNSR